MQAPQTPDHFERADSDRGANANDLASHFGPVAHKIVCRASWPALTVRAVTGGDQEQ
jgi:hypothetical protein